MNLFHYTCAHRVGAIRRDRSLKPNPHPLLDGVALVWLTDLDRPIRKALGLTSNFITCDRTEFRVTVDVDAQRWVHFARTLPSFHRDALEMADGAMPMHWWVTDLRVPVLEVSAVAS